MMKPTAMHDENRPTYRVQLAC